MFTKAFLADLAERSLSTFAQTFLAVYVVVGLKEAAISAVGASGLSVLKAIAAGVKSQHSEVGPTAALLPTSVAPVAPE